MNCSTCNHRVMGLGCLLTNKRVTDHQSCDKWEKLNNHGKHDADAMADYFKAGYILDIEKVSA